MIVLVGPSGSGKDSILKIFKEHGYQAIVSYTTRPPRHYEIDGIDYHFIPDEKFAKLSDEGFFAEQVEYRGWNYGVAREDCTPGKVVVLEPHGLKQVKGLIGDVTSVFIDADENVRLNRLCNRGDNPGEIARRIQADRELFDGVDTDYCFPNNSEDMEVLTFCVNLFISFVINPLTKRSIQI